MGTALGTTLRGRSGDNYEFQQEKIVFKANDFGNSTDAAPGRPSVVDFDIIAFIPANESHWLEHASESEPESPTRVVAYSCSISMCMPTLRLQASNERSIINETHVNTGIGLFVDSFGVTVTRHDTISLLSGAEKPLNINMLPKARIGAKTRYALRLLFYEYFYGSLLLDNNDEELNSDGMVKQSLIWSQIYPFPPATHPNGIVNGSLFDLCDHFEEYLNSWVVGASQFMRSYMWKKSDLGYTLSLKPGQGLLYGDLQPTYHINFA